MLEPLLEGGPVTQAAAAVVQAVVQARPTQHSLCMSFLLLHKQRCCLAEAALCRHAYALLPLQQQAASRAPLAASSSVQRSRACRGG